MKMKILKLSHLYILKASNGNVQMKILKMCEQKFPSWNNGEIQLVLALSEVIAVVVGILVMYRIAGLLIKAQVI